ncbi:MAG: HU family DNA-binding protein [Balneolaceae bacterium]
MNYADFIEKLSAKTDQPKTTTRKMVEATVSAIKETLLDEKGISVPELGTFDVEIKDGRKMYSPHHKTHILAPPKRVVQFSPSSVLKESVKFTEPGDE